MSSRLPLTLGVAWASIMILTALLLPAGGTWTIDDSIKSIAAHEGMGLWADTVPDGPIRARISDPSAFPALHPPFATRIEGGFAFGFSPWTRAVFKLAGLGGGLLWRLLPAFITIALWLVLARCGLPWAFLLLPLTFYSLVPWEHALSWLLLWPAVWLALKQKAESRKQKDDLTLRKSVFAGDGWIGSMLSGFLLALATLLRPETAILAIVIVAYVMLRRLFRVAGGLIVGAGVGLAGMLAWHSATSTQPAFAQIGLNLLGRNPRGFESWLTSRPAAAYGLLLRMDFAWSISLALILCVTVAMGLLWHAQKRKSKALLSLALVIFAVWIVLYQYRLWAAVLPPLSVMYSNSLFACLPWAALLLWPPYRNRPALALALAAIIGALLLAPVWEGVHWGPRIMLFAVPLLLLDLYRSGRAQGWAFHVLLVLTAVQTLGSAALVYARSSEMGDRYKLGAPHLGTPVICPTMSQCVDLAPLWRDHEFFVASKPDELKQLLVELRSAHVDTVWMHLDALDPLYTKTFPDAKLVWPHQMTVLTAGSLYRTQWRIYELVMNCSDSLWAGMLEGEAGRYMGNRQPDAALVLQREAVAIAPGSAECHNNLALIYATLGDTSAARDEATAALKLDPLLTAPCRLLEMLRHPTTDEP